MLLSNFALISQHRLIHNFKLSAQSRASKIGTHKCPGPELWLQRLQTIYTEKEGPISNKTLHHEVSISFIMTSYHQNVDGNGNENMFCFLPKISMFLDHSCAF